jgi:hypothetical protein
MLQRRRRSEEAAQPERPRSASPRSRAEVGATSTAAVHAPPTFQTYDELYSALRASQQSHSATLDANTELEAYAAELSVRASTAEAAVAKLKMEIVLNYCTFDVKQELPAVLHELHACKTAEARRHCQRQQEQSAVAQNLMHTRTMLNDALNELFAIKASRSHIGV